MSTQWQYVDSSHTIVFMLNDDGTTSSCSIDADIIQQYLTDGNTILDITLQQSIDEKTGQVNDYRDMVLNNCFTWNSNIYDSDDQSRANLTAAVAGLGIGMTLPDTFTWRTHDNQNIPMTAQDLSTFALSMLGWAETIYGVSWYHKANIAALTTVAAVTAYDITVGWPAN